MLFGGVGRARKRAYALLEAGEARSREGAHAEAVRCWQEATPLFEELEDLHGLARTLDLLATNLAASQGLRESLPLFRRVLEIRRQLADSLGQGIVLTKTAMVLAELGQLHEASETGELALPLLEDPQGVESLATVLTLLCQVAAHRCDRVALSRNLPKWLEVATRVRNEAAQAEASRMLGTLYFDQGEHARALPLWETTRQLRERAGDAIGAAQMEAVIGRAQADMGRIDLAVPLWSTCLPTLERAKDYKTQLLVLEGLTDAAIKRGDMAGALSLCERLREVLEQVGDHATKAHLLVRMAEILEHQGDLIRAMTLCRTSLRIFEELRNEQSVTGTLVVFARICGRHGDFAESRTALERALPAIDRAGDPREMALLRAWLADALCCTGDVSQALEVWRDARAKLPSLPFESVSLRTLHIMGKLCCERADVAGALDLWQGTLEHLAFPLEGGQKQLVFTAMARLSGDVQLNGHDYRLLDQAVETLSVAAGKHDVAILLGDRGHVAALMQESMLAFLLFQKAAQLQLEIGDDANRAVSLLHLASLLSNADSPQPALPLYQQAFELFDKLGNEEGKAAAAAGMSSNVGGSVT